MKLTTLFEIDEKRTLLLERSPGTIYGLITQLMCALVENADRVDSVNVDFGDRLVTCNDLQNT